MSAPSARRRLAERLASAINLVCLLLLLLTMGTVIYALLLRAWYEASYLAAAVVAIVGAVVVILGLAQQAIAARDRATWREMAIWQIRSATRKLEANGICGADELTELLGTEHTPYYEHLIATLIEDMGREDRSLALDDPA